MIDIGSLQLGILELTFIGLKYEMDVVKVMEPCDFAPVVTMQALYRSDYSQMVYFL